jgi:hypothetical protein
MTRARAVAGWLLGAALVAPVHASDFPALAQAVPAAVDAVSIAPVFDFDTDGCLPSAGISRSGDQNGGLNPSGSLTGGCRSGTFLATSNTVHRHACVASNGATYCGHFYSLYFLKDQILAGIQSGHRHDWEYAAVWTRDGVVTHGSYSAHGDLFTAAASNLPFENGHLKIVYHKDGVSTHAFRFAGAGEAAENPYGRFVTPAITSWFEFQGDGLDNEAMRTLLNKYDYGSATVPLRDNNFLGNLNTYKPAEYPGFTADSIRNPHGDVAYFSVVNQASGLCMDIVNAEMASGTDVIQWTCSGADWQKWSYDAATGAIRSRNDPRYCLDNSNVFENGANIIIWACNGSNAQRFTAGSDGYISVRAAPGQVVDGYGTGLGADVGTWGNWGGANQRWNWVQ